ncbi:MAG: glycosyltransferase family 39 protein [Planctomycetota bacterium]|nr:glycosyltransferase family 39 protein [Planctomycetota bacterium]
MPDPVPHDPLAPPGPAIPVPSTPAASAPSAWPRQFGWIALLAVIALSLFGRLHTYHQPLDRDLTTYSVIGRELLAGRRLYTEIWDNKPPLPHLVFAGAQAVAGTGPGSIYLMNALTAAAALLAVYAVMLVAGAPIRAALAAAAVYALCSFNMTLQANQPNLEAWMNPCLMGLLALLVFHVARPMNIRAALLLGLLAALATLFKHVSVFPVVAATGMYVLLPAPWEERRRRFGLMLLAGLVVLLAWALAAGHFIVRGRWHDFYDAVFYFNSHFIESGRLTLGTLLSPAFLQVVLPATLPVWVTAAIAWRSRGLASAAPHLLVAAMAAGSLAAALAPGKFFPHYFQLLFPGYALGAGLAIALAMELIPVERQAHRRSIAWAALMVVAPMAMFVVRSFELTPEQWSTKGFGTDFVETWREAPRIKAMLRPGERFYDLGAESGLYYVTGQSPPTTVFYFLPVFQGPLAPRYARQTVAELQRRPPELVTLLIRRARDLAPYATSHPVLLWINGSYRQVSDRPDSAFRLFVLRGSDLERRMLGEPARPPAPSPTSRPGRE